jgi:hypothetical protein
MRSLLVVTIVSLSVVACSSRSDPLTPGTDGRIARTVVSADQSPRLFFSPQIRHGESFRIVFQSYRDCTTVAGETHVSVSGLEVDIRPYDYEVQPRPTTCSAALSVDSEGIDVELPRAGVATATLHGRDRSGRAVSVVARFQVK